MFCSSGNMKKRVLYSGAYMVKKLCVDDLSTLSPMTMKVSQKTSV